MSLDVPVAYPAAPETLHWRAKEANLPALAHISAADLPATDQLCTVVEDLTQEATQVTPDLPFTPIPPELIFIELVDDSEGGFFDHPRTRGFDFRSNAMHLAVNPDNPTTTLQDQLTQSWLHDSIHVATPRDITFAPDGSPIWTRAGFVDRAYEFDAVDGSFTAVHLSPESRDEGQEAARPYLGALNEFFTEIYKRHIVDELGIQPVSACLDAQMLRHNPQLAHDPRSRGFWNAFMSRGYNFLEAWEERGINRRQLSDAFVHAMLTKDRSRIDSLFAQAGAGANFEEIFMSKTWAEKHNAPHDDTDGPYAF